MKLGKCVVCTRTDASTSDFSEASISHALRVSCDVCGRYIAFERVIYHFNELGLLDRGTERHLRGEQWYLISGFLREYWEKNRVPYEIKTIEDIDEILNRTLPRTLPEKIDKLLLYIASRSPDGIEKVEVVEGRDFSLAYVASKESFLHLLAMAKKMDLLVLSQNHEVSSWDGTIYHCVLSYKGWERVLKLREVAPTPNKLLSRCGLTIQ